WLLAGHYGRPGTTNAFVPLLSVSSSKRQQQQPTKAPRPGAFSPVTGAKVIMGLIPCNVIPDEILSEHPKRFRAMLIESANPVHSLADAQRMRAALRALELSVVIDVAMTETARQADYVLPASSQFEKAEATFFNMEFPRNAFHLRQPLFAPRTGTLSEAEIHARLLEALGELGPRDYRLLRGAAKLGGTAFGLAFGWQTSRTPKLRRYASVLLYRTLGTTLLPQRAPAASLWGICQMYVRKEPQAAARAGFGGSPLRAGQRLFDALLSQPSGVVYAVSDYADSWAAVKQPEQKIRLDLDEMLAALEALPPPAPAEADYPFVLSAGERRSDSSNTSVRDAGWHRKGRFGSLRIHPDDAVALGLVDGDWARIHTRRGHADALVELSDEMHLGHVSLPNGQGIDYQDAEGAVQRRGVSLNELTNTEDRDPFAGTPWHKFVPARIEKTVMA
ncbi:MAG: molybdopterin-dependent oxidoreductase, partial [Microbacteriaceae bacterium]|nr:molybdopterin-dependent oxidoreductase [Burkholderiaceae bacterium]